MTVREFEVAGTDFNLVIEEGDFVTNPAAVLTLPMAFVSGMSSASYQFQDQKQAILDALSPFQLVSKAWAMQGAIALAGRDDEIESIVYVGSWFGQLSAMMVRTCRNYAENYSIVLVDKDPAACRVAQHLVNCDRYHRRADPLIWTKDIFDCKFRANTLFVWCGLEHFDANDVERFLERNTESTFLFQSTSMPAKDHVNLANDVEDLLSVLPSGWDDGICYKGELQCALGSRYMMAVRGPGVQLPTYEDDSSEDEDFLGIGPDLENPDGD